MKGKCFFFCGISAPFLHVLQSRCGIAFPLLLDGWKRRERQRLLAGLCCSEHGRGLLLFHLLYIPLMLQLFWFFFFAAALLAEHVWKWWWVGTDRKMTAGDHGLAHKNTHTHTQGTLTLFGRQRVFLFSLCLLQLRLVETGDLGHVRLVRHFACEWGDKSMSAALWPFLSSIRLIMQHNIMHTHRLQFKSSLLIRHVEKEIHQSLSDM